ncbi:MAG: hypothetical protein B6D77_04300 [gamma proteobacterium symbiont of Ctena orbiculata]|nr:hypothetical protein [Candidatus Thiodiazotropha sp. (ex Lucina pensylvanica)]PUB74047.1 MAG: hypothetical protein DBP03_11815 [gamma proteobacterium symbiont of Ctena orbiculata]PUB79866.1 MAG: hypothetical protein DBO99_02495 [gamma proteobacterium symbiont of Ctena orbiculata]PVV13554.1 MAG: hypothetical protein B6D77_04300 [gamma proteobacterium symbiont of Ctena orbiculata]
MTWKPITESELWDDINKAFERMSPEQRKIWEIIKILPEKWSQDPWGNEGNGFWVVALIGNNVIWYNDIEDGFNQSTFSEYGKIREYWCNQDELEWAVQNIINMLHDGYDSSGRFGAPQPVA